MADQLTRLAGATVPNDSAGVRRDGFTRQYLFGTAARVTCLEPRCNWDNMRTEQPCQGRGWTAATDGWVWWQAIESTNLSLEQLVADWHEKWLSRFPLDPKAAFVAALEQTVRAIPGVEMEDE